MVYSRQDCYRCCAVWSVDDAVWLARLLGPDGASTYVTEQGPRSAVARRIEGQGKNEQVAGGRSLDV